MRFPCRSHEEIKLLSDNVRAKKFLIRILPLTDDPEAAVRIFMACLYGQCTSLAKELGESRKSTKEHGLPKPLLDTMCDFFIHIYGGQKKEWTKK